MKAFYKPFITSKEDLDFVVHLVLFSANYTAQKRKFSFKDFYGNCEKILNFLRICSHLLKKFLTKNFIFCAVLESFGSLLKMKHFIWLAELLKTKEVRNSSKRETRKHVIVIVLVQLCATMKVG